MASTRSRSRSPSHEHDYDLDSILRSSKPVIDLHLPAYEASVTNFSRAIANFTARSVTEITQRRDAHDKELKRLDGRAQDMEKETENCKLKEIELIARCVMRPLVMLLFVC
jgi:kinetochore protein Spc25